MPIWRDWADQRANRIEGSCAKLTHFPGWRLSELAPSRILLYILLQNNSEYGKSPVSLEVFGYGVVEWVWAIRLGPCPLMIVDRRHPGSPERAGFARAGVEVPSPAK